MAGVSSLIPILSYEETISHCKDCFGLQISEEDLRRPSTQFVKKFYLEAVTKILQISPEQMTQPHFQLLGELQYPELAEEGAPLIFFTLLLQRFMHACMVTDFTKNDLLNPKPKRTLTCICAVINFAMFQGSQHYVFADVMSEQETITTQSKQLQLRNEESRNKLAQIRVARAEDDEKVQRILPEVDQLGRNVHDLNRQQAVESKAIQQLKTEMAERASKEAEIKVTITNDKDVIEKLKAQIVTSPDKFRAEINKLNNTINTCKASIEEKSKTMLGLKNQMESINILEEDAVQVTKLISSVEEEADKLFMNQKSAQDLHDTVTNDEESLKKTNDLFQNVRRQLASQSEKLSRLETKNTKKVSSENFAIQQAEKELEMCKSSMKDVQHEVMEIEIACKKVRQQANEAEKSHDGLMDNMKSLYQQLLNQLDVYHSSLEKSWELLALSLSEANGC